MGFICVYYTCLASASFDFQNGVILVKSNHCVPLLSVYMYVCWLCIYIHASTNGRIFSHLSHWLQWIGKIAKYHTGRFASTAISHNMNQTQQSPCLTISLTCHHFSHCSVKIIIIIYFVAQRRITIQDALDCLERHYQVQELTSRRELYVSLAFALRLQSWIHLSNQFPLKDSSQWSYFSLLVLSPNVHIKISSSIRPS